MSARGIIGGLAGMAASAVKHPKTTTEQALLGAKEMATTGAIVADKLIKKGLGKDEKSSGPSRPTPAPVREAAARATAGAAETVEKAAEKVERTADKVADKADTVETKAERSAAKPAPKPAAKKAPKPGPAKKASGEEPDQKPAAKKQPAKPAAKKVPAKKKAPAKKPKDDHDVVLAVDFPAPPEEPPVDVVGQALAKEAEEERQQGTAGSVLPPVRDKDEAAVDPATLKAVRAEAEMMTKAASPRKS